MSDFKNKTVLVTGGAGFIGSHLCEKLLLSGCKVINVDSLNNFYDTKIKLDNLKNIECIIKNENIASDKYAFYKIDIRDTRRLDKIFKDEKIDIVVHLAAYAGVRPSIKNPELYMDVNVKGTVAVLECMRENKAGKLVFASSSSVYGNSSKIPFSENDSTDAPVSPYAASKKAGELICHTYNHLYGIGTVCLRLFTVYGPRQRPDLAIHKFTSMILKKVPIPFYGDGSSERDYTYIDDALDGIIKAMQWIDKNETAYEIFNVGESRTVSLKRLVEEIEKCTGEKAVLQMMPFQHGDVMRTWADLTKSNSVLGYYPQTEFSDGLKKFVEWYKTTYYEKCQ